MINTQSLTHKEIIEQSLNIIFFNWLFTEKEHALPGIKDDLETVLGVYFPDYDITVLITTDGHGDITAEVDMVIEDEIIKVIAELQVKP